MMLVPAGTYGPEFLVTPNFYVLKEYNNSDLYALFIGNLLLPSCRDVSEDALGQQIAGGKTQ